MPSFSPNLLEGTNRTLRPWILNLGQCPAQQCSAVSLCPAGRIHQHSGPQTQLQCPRCPRLSRDTKSSPGTLNRGELPSSTGRAGEAAGRATAGSPVSRPDLCGQWGLGRAEPTLSLAVSPENQPGSGRHSLNPCRSHLPCDLTGTQTPQTQGPLGISFSHSNPTQTSTDAPGTRAPWAHLDIRPQLPLTGSGPQVTPPSPPHRLWASPSER